MEEIQNQLETLIDDVERDETITKADIVLTLYKLKEEIEDYNFQFLLSTYIMLILCLNLL